jgi:hypothetical protein
MSALSSLAVAALLGTRLVAADIVGTVREESTGEPVAGAVVTLDDLGRSAVTDADGAYRLAAVPPGPQHLSVRLLGFQSRSLHVLVPAQGVLRVDLVLRSDPIEVEAVIVRSRIPIRGLDEEGEDLDPTRRLSQAAIRNDPFTAEPDVIGALVGGVVADTPESGGGLHVRGGDGDEVGYLLDGIPVFGPYHSGVRSGAWSPDAVAAVELRLDPTLPVEGLAATVLVTTIEPGERLRSRGELSTSQIGITLDGPVAGGAGFLLSARSGYPGLVRPPDEPSYVGGRDHDVLAKVVVPLAGGGLRFLGFDNRNVVETASRPSEVGNTPSDPGEPNRYAWRGRTFGVLWEGPEGDGPRPSVRSWRADLDTSFRWNGEVSGPTRVATDRSQFGILGALSWPWGRGRAEFGVRATRDEADYEVSSDRDSEDLAIEGITTDVVGFAHATRPFGSRLELSGGLAVVNGDRGTRALPRLGARISVAPSAVVYAEYARSEQTLQSMRSAESVVGRIFPSELFAGGASTGIPAATSDLGVVGLVATPWPGARVDLEAYARDLKGLAVLDPGDGGPFAVTGVRRGAGTVRGGAAGLTVSAAHYAATASVGLERTELRVGDTEWTPSYSAGRSARVGVIVFPTPTLSIRAGWVGQFDRRGSDVIGLLEWESCNLLDLGCEFAGSPEALGDLGARELPAYHRLDLSVRKHWHFLLRGREASVEVYATASNLLGRTNVLAFAVDPDSDQDAPIEMRPRAPLTLGLGWRF